MNYRYLLIILLFILSCNKKDPVTIQEEVGKFIDDWTYEVFVSETSNSKAIFKLWIPEGIEVQNILVLSTGGFGNGLGLVNDLDWQEFAKNKKCALLGVYITSTSYTTELLIALKNICNERNIPYIADLPFLLRGFSSGGRFSQSVAINHSARVLAYADIKGLLFSEEVSNHIPQLVIIGENDTEIRKNSLKTYFLNNRVNNKIVCFAVEPNEGHSVGRSDDLIRAFFSAVIKKRALNNNPIDETSLFLGNIDNFEYSLYANYPYDIKKASCLIDVEFSISWKKFMEGN